MGHFCFRTSHMARAREFLSTRQELPLAFRDGTFLHLLEDDSVTKKWLKQRRGAFSKRAEEFGLEFPRGVLMLGVPGCGKSLSNSEIQILDKSLYRRFLRWF